MSDPPHWSRRKVYINFSCFVGFLISKMSLVCPRTGCALTAPPPGHGPTVNWTLWEIFLSLHRLTTDTSGWPSLWWMPDFYSISNNTHYWCTHLSEPRLILERITQILSLLLVSNLVVGLRRGNLLELKDDNAISPAPHAYLLYEEDSQF